MIRQSSSLNCGAACGEMLLRSQGVFVYQEVIAKIAGAPSSAESLATVMENLDARGTWFGGGVNESSFAALNQTGLWSAMLFEAAIERIVCEDGLTQLLHTHPATARSFFRMVGNVYHGKTIKFPIDLAIGECNAMA